MLTQTSSHQGLQIIFCWSPSFGNNILDSANNYFIRMFITAQCKMTLRGSCPSSTRDPCSLHSLKRFHHWTKIVIMIKIKLNPCSRPSLKRFDTISSLDIIGLAMMMTKLVTITDDKTGFRGEAGTWEFGCDGSNFYQGRSWYHWSVTNIFHE